MSNLQAFELTITTSPTPIWPVSTLQTAGDRTMPVQVLVKNDSGNTIYLGGDTVDSTDGLPVLDGESVRLALTGDILYGIAGSSSDIHVLVN